MVPDNYQEIVEFNQKEVNNGCANADNEWLDETVAHSKWEIGRPSYI